MDLKQIQSDSCTYNRKLRRAFHKVTLSSSKRPRQYFKNSTLIKTGTIGLLSGLAIILSFTLVQYSILQSVTTASTTYETPSAAALKSNNNGSYYEAIKSVCDCDNLTKHSSVDPALDPAISSTTSSRSSSRETTASAATTYSIKKQLEISESIWERSVAQRHAWIFSTAGNNLSRVNPWDGDNYVFFWNYFPPSFNCPHSVQRVGFIGDGGKWVCGLELYENENRGNRLADAEKEEGRETKAFGKTTTRPACIIYSFGVANESSFEAEMLNRTNCQVFAYDYSVKSIGSPVEPTNARVTFKALGIGNKNLGKFRTLKFLMEQNGHEWIDILKMDIEGGEYSALDKVMQDFPHEPFPFGQLLLELHVDGKIFPRFFDWWERLEAKGLRAFFSEVNHVACAIAMVKPNFVEYSFINIRGAHRLLQSE